MESNHPLVIAVDSSTTATKAIVVDPTGHVLSEGRCELGMSTPGLDKYEQDPREWWSSTNTAVGRAVEQLGANERARIVALCSTIQRQSFALVDADGEPVRPGLLWLDGRAAEQARRIGTHDLHRLTGFQPDVTPSVYKIAWLNEHEPENVSRAARVTGVHGYLAHAMTGRWVDSAAAADSLGLFDMARLDFDDSVLAMVGLRRDQLPQLVDPGSSMGTIRRDVTRAWGLEQDVELIASCGDGQAAGLGCGAIGPDEAYLNMGTALVAGVHSATYEVGDVYRTDAAGIPGHYVLEIVQNSGSYLAGWFRTELGDPALEGAPDPALEEAAAGVPAGVGGPMVLPYWNAVQSPYWNPVAKGAIVGLGGAHGRPEIYRSILEGLSIEMARNLRGLQNDTGTPLTSVRVMGGGQRSPLWRQVMTDCVGLPLTACETEEVSAMGAAVLAMASTGVVGDIPATARAMAKLGDTSEPDAARVELYRELAEVQGLLYPALEHAFEAHSQFLLRHQR